MDVRKLTLPVSLVVAALGIAAGTGGTWASTKQQVEQQAQRIETLQHEQQANRERVLRIEIVAEQTKRIVERIERKLDR